jgi:hypothetical protein
MVLLAYVVLALSGDDIAVDLRLPLVALITPTALAKSSSR